MSKRSKSTGQTAAELNKQKKEMSCLKCGKLFRTDRCHRICSRCKKMLYRLNIHKNIIELPIDSDESIDLDELI